MLLTSIVTFNYIRLYRVKKVVVATFAFLSVYTTYAQLGPDKPRQSVLDLPNIIPPSPTVAGFMKFEETPVDNYTGIPDISIPIYSTGTHSKDININVSLKYHPSSIALDEKSSYVGLGWSLFAGGTISRTVKGKPDDLSNVGIHAIENPYYDVVNIPGTPNMTPEQSDDWNSFLWDTNISNKFDSEHDLYQFNFMGHSGRFFIENRCGITNPCFVIKKLDNDNALQIVYNQGTNGQGQFFTITDDKGYKFEFSVHEVTQNTNSSLYTPFAGVGAPYQSDGGLGMTFISAFHLSKIYDRNNNMVAEFKYKNAGLIKENTTGVSLTTNTMQNSVPASVATEITWACPTADPSKLLEPYMIETRNNNLVDTRKLQEINIVDFGKILFQTIGDRTDLDNPNAHRLSSIVVQNRLGSVIKRVELNPKYSRFKISQSEFRTRMMLGEVSEIVGAKKLSYKMSYFISPDTVNVATKDFWGYRNAKPQYDVAGNFRETNPFFCMTDALQKMELPTGGAILYNWESNTYSHIGNTPVADYYENPFNWTTTTESIGAFNAPGLRPLRFSEFDQKVNIQWDYSPTRCGSSLRKKVNGVWVNAGMDCLYGCVLEGGVEYAIQFSCIDGFGSVVPVTYFHRIEPPMEYLYGGGIRIQKIGYFENGMVPSDHYQFNGQYNDFPVAKEKLYDYSIFDEPLSSSGSLAFAKPVFEGGQYRAFNVRCMIGGGGPVGVNPADRVYGYFYNTSYDTNMLSALRTKGSDVGYKNVEVKETGNGYSRYIYTSPFEFPESTYTISFPFIATSNRDFARGFLLNEKHFAQNGDILTETINNYDFVTKATGLKTGIRAFSATSSGNTSCPLLQYYDSFAAYKYQLMVNCPQEEPQSSTCLYCNNLYLVAYQDIYEEFGWVPLENSTTKNYFYENNVQRAVETKQYYTYNPINKKIATHRIEGSSYDDTIQTNYSYTNNTSTNQISEIASIVTINKNPYDGDKTLGYEVIDWGTTGTSKGYPLRFKKSKNSTLAADTQVMQEVFSYDEFGNITSMASAPSLGGYKTIVWGYNKTLPIAVIEGGLNSEVILNSEPTKSLVLAAQTASNKINLLNNLYSESDLITKLNAIRAALPASMVTTYTYKPLVGITTETNPQGYKTTYEYDEFNRLKTVKDAAGNPRSENLYNYKTTN